MLLILPAEPELLEADLAKSSTLDGRECSNHDIDWQKNPNSFQHQQLQCETKTKLYQLHDCLNITFILFSEKKPCRQAYCEQCH